MLPASLFEAVELARLLNRATRPHTVCIYTPLMVYPNIDKLKEGMRMTYP